MTLNNNRLSTTFLLPNQHSASNKMNKTTVTTKNLVFLSFNTNSLSSKLEELQLSQPSIHSLFSLPSQNLGALPLNQTAYM